MAPSATEPTAPISQTESIVAPPKLYPPRETHFEKYIESQTDGYQSARSRGPGNAAIVIDNGKYPP